jgi:hypothetical protein
MAALLVSKVLIVIVFSTLLDICIVIGPLGKDASLLDGDTPSESDLSAYYMAIDRIKTG